MAEIGLLHEDDRVELIGGEIVEMTPIGWPHAQCVNRLNMMLASFAADSGYVVSVQNPVRLSGDTEPQPDLVLLVDRPLTSTPGPEDIALVVEVSDTSLAYDQNVKLPLYAASGVPEVWIVDLQGRRVEVHADPGPNGYRTVREAGPGEQVRSENVKGLSLTVDEMLGPPDQ